MRQTTSASMDPRQVRWIRVRVLLLGFAFAPIFAALAWRAADLQINERKKLESLARDQYLRQVTLPGRRGAINDRRGGPLAATVDVDSIYIDPTELPNPHQAAQQLAKTLKLDAHKLESSFGGGRQFAWIKRRVTPQEVEAVKALKLPGIAFAREPRRFYPQRELAAHVLGFAGMDGDGLEGVEKAFDKQLKGRPQPLAGLRDARGRALFLDGVVPAQELEGSSVTLTIDRAIQYQAEKALATAVQKAQAATGMAVVLDPATGEILALANVPTFNPNDPSRSPRHAMRNRAVTDQFEPGSTFKIFTISAALEEKVVKPTDTVYAEGGHYKVGRHTIHDHGRYEHIDIGKVMQVSSNIGTTKIAEKLGREKLAAYHRAFGFGERPGTGLQGEARGALPFPRGAIELATQSYGQGLAVSALQLTAAVGAVANGGVLMRPFLVSKVVDPSGAVVFERGPEQVRQVISQRTSVEVLKMMQRVVQKEGTAPLARMDDYLVAGKTGTAQKPDPSGGYSPDKRTASFVGVVPADRPRLVILVVIDEPKTDVYGGVLAAPAFKEIAQFALAHLGVTPANGGTPPQIAQKPEDPEFSANRARMLGA
ncbi:MAG: peptidoglycan D,D-transpeptidase FtsI family protein, partial [Myxococcales bacterium]